jgi:hypothetical protein
LLEFCFDCEVRDQEVNIITLINTLGFLREEVNETDEALEDYSITLGRKESLCIADNKESFTEIIDGALDTAYVAINLVTKALLSKGLKKEKVKSVLLELFHEVANSNLAKKKPDGTVDLKDGKIQKPEGWSKPELGKILESYLEF